MDSPNFFKYPRTPHLAGSTVVDDDEVTTDAQILNILKLPSISKVVVQEKIDGANVSVHFETEWEPVIQKRSGIVGSGEKPQYNVFRDWVYTNMDSLFAILGTKFVLFGEWVWCQHGVAYDKLPDFFIGFDILEKDSQKYVSYSRFTKMINGQFQTVPLVQAWDAKEAQQLKFSGAIQGLMGHKSEYGKELAEGLYVRFEGDQYVEFRAKIRRKTFVCGRADFDSKIVNNKLK